MKDHSPRFRYFRLIAAFVVGLVVGLGLSALPSYFKKSAGPWEDWTPVSKIEAAINECLVKEMRGQPSNMIATVYSLCAERNGAPPFLKLDPSNTDPVVRN